MVAGCMVMGGGALFGDGGHCCLVSKFEEKLCARNLGQTRIRPVCSQTASPPETSTPALQ